MIVLDLLHSPDNMIIESNHIWDNKDKFDDHVVGWVGFNCSYSGKFFGGYAGETKTKLGTIRDYQTEAIKNVMNQIPKLSGVKFINKEFQNLILPTKCIIYCDPPYKGTAGYMNKFDHNIFWEGVGY